MPFRRPVVDADLMAFVDGVLDEDRRVPVLDHIATNHDAADRVEAYLHQNANLRLLGQAFDLSDERVFCPRLQADLVQALQQQPARDVQGALPWPWGARPVWAAAAALALVVGLGAVVAPRLLASNAPGVAAVAPEQAPEQLTAPDVVLTPERLSAPDIALAPEERLSTPDASADGLLPATLQAPAVPPAADLPLVLFDGTPESLSGTGDDASVKWLRERLGAHSFVRPDLGQIGLAFKGSHVFSGSRIPAISLDYEDGTGRPLRLYVGMLDGAGGSGHVLRLVPEDQVSMTWRDGPLVFALVAPQDTPELLDVLQTVRAALLPRAVPTGAVPAEAPAATVTLPEKPDKPFVLPAPRPEQEAMLTPHVVPDTGIIQQQLPAGLSVADNEAPEAL